MASHYRGIVAALLVVFLAFVIALGFGQTVAAYSVLVGGGVLLFVMSIAFMRPRGRTPKHHTRADKIVNDMKP